MSSVECRIERWPRMRRGDAPGGVTSARRVPIKFLSGGISRNRGLRSRYRLDRRIVYGLACLRRRISWRGVEAYRRPLGRSPGWSRPRRVVCQRDRRGSRSAALSVNENLDALRAVMDDKIETDENAGQDMRQGTRKTSADDLVQRRGGMVLQIPLLFQGFERPTHSVVIDAHPHLVAIAVHRDFGVRFSRRKSRQTYDAQHQETAQSRGMRWTGSGSG